MLKEGSSHNKVLDIKNIKIYIMLSTYQAQVF